MRTKKTFSFDEERDAEKIIVEGFPNKILDYGKIYLVAKYFRHKFDYGEIRLERELIRFCKKWDENFNPVVESDQLKKWVRSAMNYDLRKITGVRVSQAEIEFLKTIQPLKDRKLLFITLVFSKALKKGGTRKNKPSEGSSPSCYIRYSNFIDIIRLSHLKNITEVQLAEIFHTHRELFEIYNPERELMRVKYADANSENGLLLENPEKMLEYYDLFFGENKVIGRCAECGCEMIKNSNKQKYCKRCSRVLAKNQKKEWWRKNRGTLEQ